MERAIVESLAPVEWEQFKRELRAACESMAPLDIRVEQTLNQFTAYRVEHDTAVRALSVQFVAKGAPHMRWRCTGPRSGGGVVFFGAQGYGVSLIMNNTVTTVDAVLRCLLVGLR